MSTELDHTADFTRYGFGHTDIAVTTINGSDHTGTVAPNRIDCWEVAESSRSCNPFNI